MIINRMVHKTAVRAAAWLPRLRFCAAYFGKTFFAAVPVVFVAFPNGFYFFSFFAEGGSVRPVRVR